MAALGEPRRYLCDPPRPRRVASVVQVFSCSTNFKALLFFQYSGHPNLAGLALLGPDPVWIGPVKRFF
jgi:hypothetical protein